MFFEPNRDIELDTGAVDMQGAPVSAQLGLPPDEAYVPFVNDNSILTFTDSTADTLVIHGCLAGYEEAWEVLFRRYSRLIYKVPLSFGFPHVEVEEIFQEIAIEIVRSLPSIADTTRLHPWIVTIARRVCIRRLRSATKYATVDLQLLENEIERNVDTLEEMLIRLEEYSLLRQALAEMEPRCRALLTQLFLTEADHSHAEIAATLHMPLGSIGPTRARCLEKLREQVEWLLHSA